MAVYETRVQDYDLFSSDGRAMSTRTQPDGVFRRLPDQPVVGVSHQEAETFCAWLTEREHQQGLIGAGHAYRLPTDLEWSWAVGIGPIESANRGAIGPEALGREAEVVDGTMADIHPWGQGPPRPGAGNFGYLGSKVGYHDDAEFTARVGSFTVNTNGLHDLAGNVAEWCGDWRNGRQESRVFRGGHWNISELQFLRSAMRGWAPPTNAYDFVGFRMVLAPADPAVSSGP